MSAQSLFDDLVELEQNSFPKKCETCGKVYESADDFVQKTEGIMGKSGFKSSEGDDGNTILEVFRNCTCGSTLLDFFADRRDMSKKGEYRRKAFDKVLTHLMENGIEREVARTELIYYMKHKESKLLDSLGVFKARKARKAKEAKNSN